jgi:cyclohexanone monooxygenase
MGSFNDLFLDGEANATAAEFVRDKIRGIVADPDVADRLTPTTVIGCKRLCVDTGYYDTFNRDNVELIDVSRSPIEEITPRGARVGDRIVELDTLVFATGFDAMTGALNRIDIRGRGGQRLSDAWSEGPRTYLGLAVAGFPNLFTITGPGSPSVLTNMVVSIEHHVDWIASCLEYLRDQGLATIEAEADAQYEWVTHVNDIAGFTLFPTCNSWYLGANVPGKPRVFMPLVGFPPYVEHCDAVASKSYEGFAVGAGT